jgi:hypothetical protein
VVLPDTPESCNQAIQLPQLDIVTIDPSLSQVDCGVVVDTINFNLADEAAGPPEHVEAVVLHKFLHRNLGLQCARICQVGLIWLKGWLAL